MSLSEFTKQVSYYNRQIARYSDMPEIVLWYTNELQLFVERYQREQALTELVQLSQEYGMYDY